MATYAVGDIQGCLEPLHCLLREVEFQPERDRLWVAGDMVNRGPQSLDTLRFLKSLGDSAHIVLGNHDLHLLAVAHQLRPMGKNDTLQEILDAPDLDELIHWLTQQSMMHWDPKLGFAMVHAGIPPQWSLNQALSLAKEVEVALRDEGKILDFLRAMYGNEPAQWNDKLQGNERLRCITNYLTRMRFCSPDGELELKSSAGSDDPPDGFYPWFKIDNRQCSQERIIFGHWAALKGQANTANIYALDTGCVWGGSLSLLRLEDETLFRCDCP
jgi:bis(5'-nucleosyl)-tetraphosphatase (symmetrical)